MRETSLDRDEFAHNSYNIILRTKILLYYLTETNECPCLYNKIQK